MACCRCRSAAGFDRAPGQAAPAASDRPPTAPPRPSPRRARSPAPLLIITGPSGSGKSALALDLAAVVDGVVINADSMQLYRELRILTARPTAEDEARVPHRLYGILAATEVGSVASWCERARAEIAACRRAGQLPIVVGGSGLYLKALTEGLTPLPPIPQEIRRAARTLFAEVGSAAFRERLAALDADAAARLRDPQRLIRAYEVVLATGRPLAVWQRLHPPVAAVGGPVVTVALVPPRPLLAAALDRRFEAMIAAGAIDEVRALLRLNLDPDLPLMKAVGVGELAAYLRGEISLPAACAAAKRATRRYAKRQVTWLRHQGAGASVIEEQYSERSSAAISTFIRRSLLTSHG